MHREDYLLATFGGKEYIIIMSLSKEVNTRKKITLCNIMFIWFTNMYGQIMRQQIRAASRSALGIYACSCLKAQSKFQLINGEFYQCKQYTWPSYPSYFDILRLFPDIWTTNHFWLIVYSDKNIKKQPFSQQNVSMRIRIALVRIRCVLLVVVTHKCLKAYPNHHLTKTY